MERTISFMNGEGSIGHNTRNDIQKYIRGLWKWRKLYFFIKAWREYTGEYGMDRK